MDKTKKLNTRRLVELALLTAIVIVLQIAAIMMRPLFPAFTISLVLMPIVIGAALCGTLAGGWLGLAFGLAVLISGDAAPFLAVNVPGTLLVVLLKGLFAGLAAGFMYKLFEKKSKTVGAIVAAVSCPIVNTGVFIIGSYIFFLPTLTEWAEGFGFANATAYIFLGVAGINFLVELGINLVLCPIIVRLIQYNQKMKI